MSNLVETAGTPAVPSETYTDHIHTVLLQTGLAKLQGNTELCDIFLEVENRRFPAHRCVLAATSDYFETMFIGTFKEGNSNTVKLGGITARAFEQVLSYAYTGTVRLNSNIINDVYIASDMFQYNSVKHYCVQFILKDLKLENCLNYYLLAELHSLEDVIKQAETLIYEDLEAVVAMPQFKELSFEIVKKILSSDEIICESEMTVINAVWVWLAHHPELEDTKKDELVEVTRYGLLSVNELALFTKEDKILGTDTCQQIQKKLLDYRTDVVSQPLRAGMFCRPRGPTCLVTVGGMIKANVSGFFDIVDTMFSVELDDKQDGKRPRFCHVRSLPGARAYSTVVECGNFLYLLGGLSGQVSGEQRLERNVFRYDVLTCHWIQMRGMSARRYRHAAAAVDGYIMVMGGCDRKGKTAASVEQYNIATDMWHSVSPMPVPLCRLAACTHNGQVYVSGGLLDNGDDVSDSVYVYDAKEDTWVLKGRLQFGRCAHGMCSDSKCLYMVGGEDEEGSVIANLEVFSPDTGQSVLVTSMQRFRSSTSAVYHDGRIYVAGGWGIPDGTKGVTSLIHGTTDSILVYHIAADTWTVLEPKLPVPVCECVCAALVLPRCSKANNSLTKTW